MLSRWYQVSGIRDHDANTIPILLDRLSTAKLPNPAH